MMRKKLLLLHLIFPMLLIGCTRTETSKETLVQKNTDAPFPAPQEDPSSGPSAGGGEAGKNGIPFESYRFNARQRPEFAKYIQPILENLAKNFPRLVADMNHILEERRWYLIPGPLKKLPAVEMGLSNFADYEQLAIQNMYEVYVDSTPFLKQMNDEDRANLILHEMLMGVRLLEYSDALDSCFAEAMLILVEKNDAQKYREARKICHTSYPRLAQLNPKLHLTDQDYYTIRTLVGDLIDDEGKVDVELLIMWMKSNHFRNY